MRNIYGRCARQNYRQWKNLLGAYIDFKQDAPGIKRPNRVQMTYEIPQNSLTQEMNTKAQGIFEENEKELIKNFSAIGYDINKMISDNKLYIDYVYIERKENNFYP